MEAHPGRKETVCKDLVIWREQSIPSKGNLARLEWVQNPDVQLPEIHFISRDDDQLVNARSGSNHSVLKQSVWFSVHDSAHSRKHGVSIASI